MENSFVPPVVVNVADAVFPVLEFHPRHYHQLQQWLLLGLGEGLGGVVEVLVVPAAVAVIVAVAVLVRHNVAGGFGFGFFRCSLENEQYQ